MSSRAAMMDSLLERVREIGAPVVDTTGWPDSVMVTFVVRAEAARAVSLVGGPANADRRRSRMENIAGTPCWVAQLIVPASARFLYVFSVNDTLSIAPGTVTVDWPKPFIVIDSLNRQSASYAPGSPASLFEGTRAASLALSLPHATAARGTVTNHTLRSATLGAERDISVYRPRRDGAADTTPPPLVIWFDAAPFTSDGYVPGPTILDNLIDDRRIEPPVVVFVHTPQPGRRVDLWLSPTFADFVTDELIPWARREYKTSLSADRTIIAGSSLGGLTAAYVALRRPDVVRNVISQSGSYWTGMRQGADTAPEWLYRDVRDSPVHPVRFWMEVGMYEGATSNPVGMWETNHHLRDLLVAKGYSVRFSEFAGGHEYINWRASMPVALEYFLGSATKTP